MHDKLLHFLGRSTWDDRAVRLEAARYASAAALSVHAIGQAYAAIAEITPKSGVKQVDRLLSNSGLPLDDSMRPWVRHVVGTQAQLLLAMDWTDFDEPHSKRFTIEETFRDTKDLHFGLDYLPPIFATQLGVTGSSSSSRSLTLC